MQVEEAVLTLAWWNRSSAMTSVSPGSAWRRLAATSIGVCPVCIGVLQVKGWETWRTKHLVCSNPANQASLQTGKAPAAHLVGALSFAPAVASTRTTSTWPLKAATCSGVSPSCGGQSSAVALQQKGPLQPHANSTSCAKAHMQPTTYNVAGILLSCQVSCSAPTQDPSSPHHRHPSPSNLPCRQRPCWHLAPRSQKS